MTPSSNVRSLTLTLLLLSAIAPAASLAAETAAPSRSPYASVAPVGPGQAQWTNGFWADRMQLFRETMLPSMQAIMEGTERSHYFENFRIAAGEADGRSRGAPFNDGDFYKWMQAACHWLAIQPDPQLESKLDAMIDTIAQAQREDGYLHTPVLIGARKGDPDAVPFRNRHNFELYNMGHLFSTAATHFQVTGKTSLLEIAAKAADFLDTTFADAPPEAARSSVCPSHYMGMVDLWRTTRESRYLQLVEKFFRYRSLIEDGGDDNQDRIPFEEQTEAVGHAVRANYLYAGAADLYMETGNATYWRPLPKIWENLVSKKMYVTGGCGALYDGASPDGSSDQRSITRTHQAYGRNYQLPNTTAHNETCASIGNVLWNWRMFLATGGARYVDILELALYNSVLSGVGLDGTTYFYTNPLRVTVPLPQPLRWSRTRVPYVSAFCCPPNVLRTLAESSTYGYATSKDAVWINLYGASSLETRIGDHEWTIQQETEYPWVGRVDLTIQHSHSGPSELAIHLRIPAWASGSTVQILRTTGVEDPVTAAAGSYMRVAGPWQSGDRIRLELPLRVRLMESHPLVEETRGHLAVQRGPLVYCLEAADLPTAVDIHDVSIAPVTEWAPRFDADLLGGVIALNGSLEVLDAQDWSGQLYREFRRSQRDTIPARLIPYAFWANRGPTEMTVWIPIAPARPRAVPR